jgi:GNAT superfamily N-acetyltransferase
MDADITIRDAAPGEEEQVLDLVMRSFDQSVRPDFSDEGVAEFSRAARSLVMEHPAGHLITVAERDGSLLGMIDVRDLSHISLFFVEPSEQGHGVGRALLKAAIEQSIRGGISPLALTANSSPWAVTVYERLGFVPTGPLIEHNGMRAVPMAMRRPGDIDCESGHDLR